MTRAQIISNLKNCGDADADRINNRLQQCNVRILRTNGSIEPNTEIKTRLQLASALENDVTIDSIQYHFNGEWVTAQ